MTACKFALLTWDHRKQSDATTSKVLCPSIITDHRHISIKLGAWGIFELSIPADSVYSTNIPMYSIIMEGIELPGSQEPHFLVHAGGK